MTTRPFDICRNLHARSWLLPAVVALVVWGTIVATCGVGHPQPREYDGPGVTLDEPFNVDQGIRFAERLREGDFSGFARQTAVLPDHPPAGRVWLGLAREISLVVAGLTGWGSGAGDLSAARRGSATAFALTILLIGTVATCWYGRFAGLCASLAVALMPRLYGHAHLASLESCVNLSYAAALVYLAVHWSRHPPTLRSAALGGVLFGLALLTKIQAIFLPPVVIVWSLIRWRLRSLAPLAVWGVVGAATFFACWPWLWEDPPGRIARYLGRTTDRAVILAWYQGHAVVDRDVPWHYPWVMFLTTVPAATLLLGVAGAVWPRRRAALSEPLNATESPAGTGAAECLVVAGIVLPLVAFSLSGVPVYDGERLFSMVFPLWALLAGRGAEVLTTRRASVPLAQNEAAARPPRFHRDAARWIIGAVLLAGLVWPIRGLISTAPCHLSYYNEFAGGLGGAERLGLPTTYWGDSLTPAFLEQAAGKVPPGSTIQVCPVMVERLQLAALLDTTPAFRERQFRLVPWHTDQSPYVLVFARKEYLPPEFRDPPQGQVLLELRREGVLLAALLQVR